MNSDLAPFTVAGYQISPEAMLPLSLLAIVAVIMMIGVRRELATFAIAAGVIGALMMR